MNEDTIKIEYTPEKASEIFPDERLKDGTDLQKAQRVMLRILKVFDAICCKHALTYWLDAGTSTETIKQGKTQYRYRDRSKVNVYYFRKLMSVETTADPSANSEAFNVVKYVKYKAK